MARARNIKPQFFKNEYLAQLSPYARLLFMGLWCMADVKGRMEYRPARIRGELFPYESVDIDALLNELASSPERFIVVYQVGGASYLEIPNFSKHQNPHIAEKKAGSSFPANPKTMLEKSGTETVQAPDLYSASTVLVPDKQGASTVQVGCQYGTNASSFLTTENDPASKNSSESHFSEVPYKYGASTVLAPEQYGANRSDSLNLIPDSLSPETGKNSDPQKSHSLPDGKSEGDEIEKFALEGFQYLLSLNHPNFSSPTWATGYLKIQLQELEKSRPDLTKQEILRIWRDVCDQAVHGKVTSPNWFKKVFPDKLDSYTPEPPKTHALADLSSQSEALLKFPYIRHLHMVNCWWKSEELEIRPESPSGLSHKKTFDYYPVGHLEGLMEEPEYAEL